MRETKSIGTVVLQWTAELVAHYVYGEVAQFSGDYDELVLKLDADIQYYWNWHTTVHFSAYSIRTAPYILFRKLDNGTYEYVGLMPLKWTRAHKYKPLCNKLEDSLDTLGLDPLILPPPPPSTDPSVYTEVVELYKSVVQGEPGTYDNPWIAPDTKRSNKYRPPFAGRRGN